MSDDETKRPEQCSCEHFTSNEALIALLPKHIEAIHVFAGAVAELAKAVGDMVAMGAEEDSASGVYLDGSEIGT